VSRKSINKCRWNDETFSLFRRGENFIYPVLNWNQKPELAIGVYFGVIIIAIVLHSSIFGIHVLRRKIHSRYCQSIICRPESKDFTELPC